MIQSLNVSLQINIVSLALAKVFLIVLIIGNLYFYYCLNEFLQNIFKLF